MTSIQEIKVDALGRPVCAYDEKDPVSLRVLGRQTIERFSIIHHDGDLQKFYIVFDRASPYRAGRLARFKDFEDRAVTVPGPYSRTEDADMPGPLFDTYAGAVAAERALLSAMMARGEI